MLLYELLGVRPGLTAVIGSGGKTTLLRRLAEELRARGTVLLTTTTHIKYPDWCPVTNTESEMREALCRNGLACVGTPAENGKLSISRFSGWQTAADFVLVEADGSKRLPAKAHAYWEPVLPPERNRTICVFGAAALGQPIASAAHRPALYASLAEAEETAAITSVIASRVLRKELHFDLLFINQTDVLSHPEDQLRPFADALPCPVFAGSLLQGAWSPLPPKNDIP